jgi:hypothetical protein
MGLLKWGKPASVVTEYAEHGITLTAANNDRAAGYSRLLELFHVEPGRIAPPWSQVPASVGGAPRLYISRRCSNLIDQVRSAPVAQEGVGAGLMVDPKAESSQLHAVAALRYGGMSRPSVAFEPVRHENDHLIPPDDPRELRREALRRHIEERENGPVFRREDFIY